MKEILQKARKARTIYGCSFCKRTNVRKATMEAHEAQCYYNPERSDCPMCCEGGSVERLAEHGQYVEFDCLPCRTWLEVQMDLGNYDIVKKWCTEWNQPLPNRYEQILESKRTDELSDLAFEG